MSFTVRDSCRLCDAKLPDERVLDLGNSPLANALITEGEIGMLEAGNIPYWLEEKTRLYPLHIKQCSACGHCQLPVVVDPKLLFPADYPYAASTGAAFRKHLDALAKELDRRILEPVRSMDSYDFSPTAVVEFGSNDGYLLQQFARRGNAVVGVDPAANLARAATRSGVLTIPDFFDEDVVPAIVNATGGPSLVVGTNVFAHADNLNGIVRAVKKLGGDFVFEVGYLPDILRTNNFPVVYAEHLSYHHVAPLVAMFERHKMRLYDVEFIDPQGGSVRCYVEPGKGKRTKRMEQVIAREEAVIAEFLPTWPARVEQAANNFASTLTRLKQQGKAIAGYGCSAKSTTLLHVAGIGRETIDFICDDAPTKQGKFSPGKHIPIVPGAWLEEKQPDVCVSLSGNFSDAFKAAHPEFKGEWVEPHFT